MPGHLTFEEAYEGINKILGVVSPASNLYRRTIELSELSIGQGPTIEEVELS